jgi:hypothetical protein
MNEKPKTLWIPGILMVLFMWPGTPIAIAFLTGKQNEIIPTFLWLLGSIALYVVAYIICEGSRKK